MIVLTTSRDPSRRTRSFCRVISRFMNWRYVQRGKTSLESILNEFENVVVVKEIKGNPSFMDFYRNGEREMTWRMNVGVIRREKMDDSHVYFAGKVDFDPLLLGALPKIDAGERFVQRTKPKKIVHARGGRLEFRYGKKPVLTMKVLRIHEGHNKD